MAVIYSWYTKQNLVTAERAEQHYASDSDPYFRSYLHAGHPYAHCADDQQVVSQKSLQLGDATALQGKNVHILTESHERQHIAEHL